MQSTLYGFTGVLAKTETSLVSRNGAMLFSFTLIHGAIPVPVRRRASPAAGVSLTFPKKIPAAETHVRLRSPVPTAYAPPLPVTVPVHGAISPLCLLLVRELITFKTN